MCAFSAGFAGAGYLALGVWGLGARGLVLANAVNMGMRIWWSAGFVGGWLSREGVRVGWGECLPSWGTGVMGVAVAGGMRVLERGFDGGWVDLVKCAGVAGGYGVLL